MEPKCSTTPTRPFDHFFTQRDIDKIVCDFSLQYGHAFTETQQNTLVVFLHSSLNAIVRDRVADLTKIIGDKPTLHLAGEYNANTEEARVRGEG